MNYFIGTSGYAYREWKGSFYPEKLPAKQYLNYYGQHFGAVEANNTFYKLPPAGAMAAAAAEVPAGFRFAVKAPQAVTHIKRLKPESADSLTAFLALADELKEKLGPLLFQLPPNFKKDAPRLADFLRLVPEQYRAAFEFRHASWFDNETFAILRKRNTALCIADEKDDLNVPFEATADWGYLRLRRGKYTGSQLEAWAKMIRSQTWTDAFVFFMHEDTGTGPKLAAKLSALLAA